MKQKPLEIVTIEEEKTVRIKGNTNNIALSSTSFYINQLFLSKGFKWIYISAFILSILLLVTDIILLIVNNITTISYVTLIIKGILCFEIAVELMIKCIANVRI